MIHRFKEVGLDESVQTEQKDPEHSLQSQRTGRRDSRLVSVGTNLSHRQTKNPLHSDITNDALGGMGSDFTTAPSSPMTPGYQTGQHCGITTTPCFL